MKTVGFALNDFDFIIHAFQLTGMERIITVVEDTVAVPIEHIGELGHRLIFERSG
jgi:hypothetical protein